MEYPWAVAGAKVEYIGPPEFASIDQYGYPRGLIKVPLVHGKVYTIYDTEVLHNNLGLRIVECITTGYFNVVFFRPLSEKDSEMFNEMLNKLPIDLAIEELDKIARKDFENVDH